MAINRGALQSKQAIFQNNILLNLGRTTCYITIGALFTWINISLFHLTQLSQYASLLRIIAACIIFIIGARMILGIKFPNSINFIGDTIWSYAKKMHRPNKQNNPFYTFRNGMVWGLLPCGLLYSVLLSAALSGSVIMGMQIMLGFALGTLPSLLLSGTALILFRNTLNKQYIQIIGGLFFCAGAMLMFFAPYILNMDFSKRFPGLIQIAFCLN